MLKLTNVLNNKVRKHKKDNQLWHRKQKTTKING